MVSERELKVIVVPRVQDRIDDHARWWRKHRSGARTSFGAALLATYESIKRAPKLGVEHRIDGRELEIWTSQLATGHVLYFTIVSTPPQPAYILIVGVKGPGEAEPFMSA